MISACEFLSSILKIEIGLIWNKSHQIYILSYIYNFFRRLQDDLTSALKDCKISQKKLVLAQKEVEDLKQRLQNYVSEVQRVEEVLAQKVIAMH
jgi:hypothetical protein